MKNSKKRKPKSQPKAGTLADLLARFKIKAWDYLIVGDGSGSNWDREAGWASVSIDRVTLDRQVWYGAVNRGTVNVAEMMAYLQPLEWIVAAEGRRRAAGAAIRVVRVHIVTDSEYCRVIGSRADRSVEANAGLWAAFDAFARQGVLLTWHHLGRNQCGLNVYADKLSKLARLMVRDADLRQKTEDAGPTAYEVCPAPTE